MLRYRSNEKQTNTDSNTFPNGLLTSYVFAARFSTYDRIVTSWKQIQILTGLWLKNIKQPWRNVYRENFFGDIGVAQRWKYFPVRGWNLFSFCSARLLQWKRFSVDQNAARFAVYVQLLAQRMLLILRKESFHELNMKREKNWIEILAIRSSQKSQSPRIKWPKILKLMYEWIVRFDWLISAKFNIKVKWFFVWLKMDWPNLCSVYASYTQIQLMTVPYVGLVHVHTDHNLYQSELFSKTF